MRSVLENLLFESVADAKEIDHTHVVGIRHLRRGSIEPQQCQVPGAVPELRGYRAWNRRGRACRDVTGIACDIHQHPGAGGQNA